MSQKSCPEYSIRWHLYHDGHVAALWRGHVDHGSHDGQRLVHGRSGGRGDVRLVVRHLFPYMPLIIAGSEQDQQDKQDREPTGRYATKNTKSDQSTD